MKNNIRNYINTYPFLFIPISSLRYRFKNPGKLMPVSWGVDLVIDGYPRSANSFAVNAFFSAQEEPVRVSHHLHAAANIIYAAKRNIPVLLLVRTPEDAVPSYAIYSSVSLMHALNYNIRFHRHVAPFIQQLCVADFHQIRTDYGAVMHRLNRKYNLNYRVFEHTKENEEHCFQVGSANAKKLFPDRDDSQRLSIPNAAKKEKTLEMKNNLLGDAYAEKMEEARRLYRVFSAAAYAES
jgi:hypothetical protein